MKTDITDRSQVSDVLARESTVLQFERTFVISRDPCVEVRSRHKRFFVTGLSRSQCGNNFISGSK